MELLKIILKYINFINAFFKKFQIRNDSNFDIKDRDKYYLMNVPI